MFSVAELTLSVDDFQLSDSKKIYKKTVKYLKIILVLYSETKDFLFSSLCFNYLLRNNNTLNNKFHNSLYHTPTTLNSNLFLLCGLYIDYSS